MIIPLKTLFLFPLRSLSIPLGATDLGGDSPFFILIPSFLLPLSICRGRARYRSLPPPPLPTHLLIWYLQHVLHLRYTTTQCIYPTPGDETTDVCTT